MATSSILFWVILRQKEGEKVKGLCKGINWLLLTLLEQSVEPLVSNRCEHGQIGGNKKRKECIRLLAMGTWFLFGIILTNFYKGDLYTYLTIQVTFFVEILYISRNKHRSDFSGGSKDTKKSGRTGPVRGHNSSFLKWPNNYYTRFDRSSFNYSE